MVDDVAVHRALASPVRASLLEMLVEQDGPAGVRELADELGLHTNTIRAHLAVLEHAGLVTSSLRAPRERGRPRHLYSAAVRTEPDPDTAYRLLAALLAELVASDHPEPDQAAEEAAVGWGLRLALSDTSVRASPDEPYVDRLVALFDALGFEPLLEAEGGDGGAFLSFGRCAFQEVARSQPGLACAVHRGLLRGALDASDDDGALVELVPAADGACCTAHLQDTR